MRGGGEDGDGICGGIGRALDVSRIFKNRTGKKRKGKKRKGKKEEGEKRGRRS